MVQINPVTSNTFLTASTSAGSRTTTTTPTITFPLDNLPIIDNIFQTTIFAPAPFPKRPLPPSDETKLRDLVTKAESLTGKIIFDSGSIKKETVTDENDVNHDIFSASGKDKDGKEVTIMYSPDPVGSFVDGAIKFDFYGSVRTEDKTVYFDQNREPIYYVDSSNGGKKIYKAENNKWVLKN